YLALTLQGQTYERMVSRAIKEFRKEFRREEPSWWRQQITILIATLASMIVAWALIGEWAAIFALAGRSSSGATEAIVQSSLITLLIAAVTGPALRMISIISVSAQTAAKPSHPASDDSEDSSE